jgi:branched-chain amino acid transport system substrate-binding protein
VRFSRTGRVAAVAAAIAIAAAGCGNDTTTSASGANGDKCDVALGFFGALTGDNANLGKNMFQGVELAMEQYNAKHANCKVGIEQFDSQGSPDQAPGLATQAINNKKVVGIVGPAFSGESKAADPLFNEAGLPLVTPGATNPALSQNGWKVFHRILGSDATQGPAAARYIKDVLKAQKVFVVDDASEYGKGLADQVKEELGSALAGTDTVQAKQTDFSATVTKVKSSGATAVFYGGYYAEAGPLRKQLSDAGSQNITMVAGDGVKDDGFITGAGQSAAEGTVITCPCNPPDKVGGSFYQDFKTKYGIEPPTYAAEAYDATNVFLDGINEGKASRTSLLDWVAGYDKAGVTKQIKFDDKGEPTNVVVWAYKVQAGKIVADQEIK